MIMPVKNSEANMLRQNAVSAKEKLIEAMKNHNPNDFDNQLFKVDIMELNKNNRENILNIYSRK